LVLHVAEVLGHGEGGQRHPEAPPRGLVHLAVDQGGLLDDARLLHLDPQVGALSGALPHPGEDRDAAVLEGDPVDHLLDEHGLAHTGAAEQADLATLHVGLEQVDDLDARLEHDGPGLQGVEVGGGPVDLPVVLRLPDRVGVERLAQHVEHVAEHGVTDGHLQATPEVAHHCTAGQAVGGLQADAADPAVTDLLGHLGRDDVLVALELAVHLDGAVDLRQGVGRELHVDDRSGDGHHPAGGQRAGFAVLGCSGGHERRAPLMLSVTARWRRMVWQRSVAVGTCTVQTLVSMTRPPWSSPVPARSASAPLTISMISVVMVSCRARFMIREYFLMSSPALSVAAAMARWRAVSSDAVAWRSAAKISVSAARGPRVSSRMAASGSNSV